MQTFIEQKGTKLFHSCSFSYTICCNYQSTWSFITMIFILGRRWSGLSIGNRPHLKTGKLCKWSKCIIYTLTHVVNKSYALACSLTTILQRHRSMQSKQSHTGRRVPSRLTATQSWYSRNPEKVLYFQVLP